MEYRGVEYTIIQLLQGGGWRWTIDFGDGKRKSGETPNSRAAAIEVVHAEIDRFIKNRK
jgi:hypothetical protein